METDVADGMVLSSSEAGRMLREEMNKKKGLHLYICYLNHLPLVTPGTESRALMEGWGVGGLQQDVGNRNLTPKVMGIGKELWQCGIEVFGLVLF